QRRESRVTCTRRGVRIEAQIRILHRTFDAAVERHAEEIRETEVASTAALFVMERRGEGCEQGGAPADVVLQGVALRVRQCCRIRQNQQLEAVEPIRRKERLVHQLERNT